MNKPIVQMKIDREDRRIEDAYDAFETAAEV